MARSLHRPTPTFKLGFSFTLMCLLLTVLWLAGGASRPDVLGQTIVRGVAWLGIILLALAGGRPVLGQARPVAVFLLAMIALALIQLVPLPPAVWSSLPGREELINASLAGVEEAWRPISLIPAATLNALFSLVVPLAIFLCASGLSEQERARLPDLLLILVVASMIVGLAQFSGVVFDNPFINETIGRVNGTFANPNHFALILAIGCLVVPTWALEGGRRPGWRMAAAIGLLPLLVLTILASGSRAGMLLGVVGICLGLITQHATIRDMVRVYPRWVFPVLILAIVIMLICLVLVSFAADRAQSINRLLEIDNEHDIRARALPIVLAMVKEYFPFGTGLGTFDPLFRLHEPFELLKRSYFNHAHNDFLEIILDTGLAGGLLLLSAVGWWGWRTAHVWRASRSTAARTPARLGSAIILLVMIASVVDYPARTPTVMAIIVLAALLLAGAPRRSDG